MMGRGAEEKPGSWVDWEYGGGYRAQSLRLETRASRSFWRARVFSLLTVLGAIPHCWAISAGVSPWRVAWIRAASRGLSEERIASWSVLRQSDERELSGRFIEATSSVWKLRSRWA